MSWAAARNTTKPEDAEYCLLGIFGVNTPLIYGEGGAKAILRLQDEIMKTTRDQTLLTWDIQLPQAMSSLHQGRLEGMSLPQAAAHATEIDMEFSVANPLADSLERFDTSGIDGFRFSSLTLDNQSIGGEGCAVDDTPALMTSRGLHLWTLLFPCSAWTSLTYIKCRWRDQTLCILLVK